MWFSDINFPGTAKKTFFWKAKSATISDLNPQYQVIYLGNVLTGWAKGNGCSEKPLSTLWRNHVGTEKSDILMNVTITGQGLKAITKEHGLTEYWSHRITYCSSDAHHPRVFCWIYRHEGRKMKQELRCHAVLCPSENKCKMMAFKLQERLHQALVDFKKEKMSRQNARLSLVNTLYDDPFMPYRKIMLHTGTSNYRPPLDKSKSAPKLKSIDEVVDDDDDQEIHTKCDLDSTNISPSPERIYIPGLNLRKLDNSTSEKKTESPSSDSFPKGHETNKRMHRDTRIPGNSNKDPILTDYESLSHQKHSYQLSRETAEDELKHHMTLNDESNDPDNVSEESGFADENSHGEDNDSTPVIARHSRQLSMTEIANELSTSARLQTCEQDILQNSKGSNRDVAQESFEPVICDMTVHSAELFEFIRNEMVDGRPSLNPPTGKSITI